jgi:hypothetical protein
MSILKLLASTNFLTLNKSLAKKLSLEAAILYADLASSQIYFGDGEWFFRTRETIQEETTLSKYQQIKGLKLLLKHGLIKEKMFGLPAKKHYLIDEECMLNLNDLLQIIKTTSRLKIKRQGSQNLNDINNNIVNKNISNNKEKKIIKKKKPSFEQQVTYPESFSSEVIQAIEEHIEMRKEIKKPYKSLTAIKRKFKSLEAGLQKFGEQKIIEAINFCTENQYQGINIDWYLKTTKQQQNETNKETGLYTSYARSLQQDEHTTNHNGNDFDW